MTTMEQPMSDMSIAPKTKLVSPELDWSAKAISRPQRTYSKIAVINGVNSGTLSTSTQGAFSFQIPAKVLSLKDSYVSMDLSIATAGGAATASVIAGNLSNLFSRVVISADNNAVLADINDFHRYTSMLTAPSMKFETLEQECVGGMEFLPSSTNDAAGRLIVSDMAKANPYNVLQKNSIPCFTAAATVPTIIADKAPLDRFTGAITGAAFDTSGVHQENLNPNSYRHYLQQTAATPLVSAYSIQFRLKDLLPNTICALDQLLYFGGSQLQFDFYINSVDYIGYLATTTALTGDAPAALPATTFSNFSFNLCCENNVNTINAVIQKVKNEGLTIPIPYVYGSKTTITGSSSHSVNQVITRSAGERLMWVAWSPFFGGAERDIINSHSQLVCSAITGQGTFTNVFSSYNTSLDNIFIKSQSTIDCLRGEHYLYNKNELRGSALQGLEALSNDFVHIDSWISKPLCEYDPSVEDGLPITENHTWGLTSTFTDSTSAYQHYVYYCVQRKLVIGNFSVQVI